MLTINIKETVQNYYEIHKKHLKIKQTLTRINVLIITVEYYEISLTVIVGDFYSFTYTRSYFLLSLADNDM